MQDRVGQVPADSISIKLGKYKLKDDGPNEQTYKVFAYSLFIEKNDVTNKQKCCNFHKDNNQIEMHFFSRSIKSLSMKTMTPQITRMILL